MQKTLAEILRQYESMGFQSNIIRMAWDNVKGDESRLIEQIFKLNEKNQTMTDTTVMQSIRQKQVTAMEEEEMLGKVIQESLDEAKAKKISFEPLNPEQRLRKSGIPVGLKNIGNTCYFNSLLQTYFYNISFVKEILSFKEPEHLKNVKDAEKGKDPELKRKLASVQLVKSLQLLFAGMIISDKKYLDPTSVITSVVDDYGNELPIGDQKDIAEFNLFFLARVEEAISLQDKYSGKRIAEESRGLEDSPSKVGVIGDHMEMMKRSSIKIMEESTIDRQFIGKHETTFINDRQNIRKVEEEMFTLLYVNVRNRELYSAFEEVIVSSIDDYRNEKGEIVSVEKQCWIKEAPRTLFFQIERVVFDKEKVSLRKIHDKFEFPREFHVDPFMEANKLQSLKIRSEVNKLRKQKAGVEDGLNRLTNYDGTPIGLDKVLQLTLKLLERSGMEVQNDPTVFPELLKQVNPQFLQLLGGLKKQTEERIELFRGKHESLEKLIEQSYRCIMTTEPYLLQSILIHEGQADSGHYYSYSFDGAVWRKYNDSNVTEEAQEQVFKEAKGLNMASAYCLVYAKPDRNFPQGPILRSYKLSSEAGYCEDIYSSFINPDVRAMIQAENIALQQEIVNYKVGGFVSKVMDHYVKRFESLNELFRKLKIPERIAEKKKSNLPSLINLPLYVRSVTNPSQEEYKAAIMQSSVLSFGPKEDTLHFEEILTKKLTNLNDFKRPKHLLCKQQFVNEFMQGCRNAVQAKFVYDMIAESQWPEVLAALNMLRREATRPAPSPEYFLWLVNVLGKLVLLQLPIEIEQLIDQKNFDLALYFMKLLGYQFGFTCGVLEEPSIHSNLIMWLAELMIPLPELMKPEGEAIVESIRQKKPMPEYTKMLPEVPKELEARLAAMDYTELMWNFAKQEDVLINDMAVAQERVSAKLKATNDLLREIKKSTVPLSKEGRDKVIRPK